MSQMKKSQKLALLPFILLTILSCSETDFSFLPLNNSWIVDNDEATRWSMVKHNNLPTLTGSKEWKNYMAFLENEFKKPISNKHMSVNECLDRHFSGNIMILLLIIG